MKKTLRISAAFLVMILLNSCLATHTGYMNSSASLSSPNFTYVSRDIRGSASATYILGIGGLAKSDLIDDAKENMLYRNPLKPNQAIANVTVSFKNSTIFYIYGSRTCTITADIVEFK